MIPLRIDQSKLLSLGVIMMPPDDVILDLVSRTPGVEDAKEFTKIRSLIQLQILDRDTFRVRDSAVLAPDELLKLMYLAKAVGKQAERIASIVDSEFEGYKNLVRKAGGG